MAAEARPGLIRHPDGRKRCWWAGTDPTYVAYHDQEWGRPPANEAGWFEALVLETFQSGLSFQVILNKREGFRAAFAGFDAELVAAFTAHRVTELLGDPGIVRHRGKIEATIANARAVLELRHTDGGLSAFARQWVPPPEELPSAYDRAAMEQAGVPATARAFSRALKKLGFRFVGPTTVYAFMQATGIVDDHVEGCHCRGAAALAGGASAVSSVSSTGCADG